MPRRPGCPPGLRPLGWHRERGSGFVNGESEASGGLELWRSLARTCFEFLNALRYLLNGRRLPLNARSLLRNPFTQPLQLVVRAFWRMGQGVLFRHGSRVRT